MGVFGAGAYFKEFDSMMLVSYILFPIGIFIIAIGIISLMMRETGTDLEMQMESVDFPNVNPQQVNFSVFVKPNALPIYLFSIYRFGLLFF
jgi:hypothetical protein